MKINDHMDLKVQSAKTLTEVGSKIHAGSWCFVEPCQMKKLFTKSSPERNVRVDRIGPKGNVGLESPNRRLAESDWDAQSIPILNFLHNLWISSTTV